MSVSGPSLATYNATIAAQFLTGMKDVSSFAFTVRAPLETCCRPHLSPSACAPTTLRFHEPQRAACERPRLPPRQLTRCAPLCPGLLQVHDYPMGAPCYPAASGMTPSCTGAATTCTLINYLNRTRMDTLTAYLEKYKQLVSSAGNAVDWRCPTS